MHAKPTTLPQNKNVLLLNSFVNECFECDEEDNYQRNGDLYCDTPIGLISIYTYVQQMLPELNTSIIDSEALMYNNAWKGTDYCWDQLLEKIQAAKPQVIGLSLSYYYGARMFHETTRRIKEHLPDCVIVAGGNYPTDATDIVLEDPNLDYVLKSEGEATFVEFLQKYYASENVKDIDGICYSDAKEGMIINPKVNYMRDISILPIPDRSALDMNSYGWGRHVIDRMQPGARFLTMITSRGCPFKCTFCSNKHFWGQRIKYRSIEQVVDEMEILKFKYGADIIGFNDDNFFTHKRRCEKVFDEINRRKLKMKWFAQGGTLVQSLADEKFLEKALESGLCFLNLAIESSSEKTLRLIRKPLKLDNANALVNHVKKKYPELYMNSGFIIGFPFETKAEIIHTFEYSKKLELDWAVYNNFRPMPGTELYDTCVEEGIIEKFTFNNYDDTSRPYSEEAHFDGPDWTKEWLMDTMYKYNLDVNFINSYNMRIGNYQQALNDFEYVARSFKGQAIAHRQASLCASKLGLSDKAQYHAFEEQKIMSQPGKSHDYYEQFSIKPIHSETRVA
ncbi:MAG: radical SAM protein [Myxococcota bacterium]|jgi:magnesium-protoporphyrin IX monomethyl ester (oxidative) cyclase|nr:radical SAM protein [Myxococcota bacterium]